MEILNQILEITSDNLYNIVMGYILSGRGYGLIEDVTRSGDLLEIWADRERKYLIGWIGIQPHTAEKARVEVIANKAQGDLMVEFMRKLTQYILLAVDGQEESQPKNRGRYRLIDEEIKFRKGKVEEARKLKKVSPGMYWKQIAIQVGIPESTLRDWRRLY